MKAQQKETQQTFRPKQFYVTHKWKRGIAPKTGAVAPTSFSSRTHEPRLTQQVCSVLKWPTDTVSIDYYDDSQSVSKCHCPHTILLFVPGNPGCIGWYADLLFELVGKLGVGFAARGVSYAGHGVTADIANVERWERTSDESKSIDNEVRDVDIPWTVDGQINHKIAWIDLLAAEMKELQRNWAGSHQANGRSVPLNYIFISHSIGAHMVQRLCVLRPDILEQTKLLIHLMPFIRMDAPQPQHAILSTLACSQDVVISATTLFSRLAALAPPKWVDSLMKSTVPDGRELAVGLVRQPKYPKNFFNLGTEEIRDVPERPDDSALRLIGKRCPTAMLYCGGPDQWAPYFHMDDLKALQERGLIPGNIRLTYMPTTVHDFIVRPEMVPPVVEFCLQSIYSVVGVPSTRSKL